MRSHAQMAKMNFLHRVAGLSLRRGGRVEPPLPHVKRSQMRWFGHLSGRPGGHPLLQVFWTHPTRRPWGRPRTHWRDYISHLDWECLRIPQEDLEKVTGESLHVMSLHFQIQNKQVKNRTQLVKGKGKQHKDWVYFTHCSNGLNDINLHEIFGPYTKNI